LPGFFMINHFDNAQNFTKCTRGGGISNENGLSYTRILPSPICAFGHHAEGRIAKETKIIQQIKKQSCCWLSSSILE
ncbi:hypothetical protein, partial [Paenibacillus elgii]|uniref:hypothetical protein n=1 Tax=Paenibacillus elgii TaxID=189691 RepID=UPI0019544A64